jgi:hypothetical protein
VEGTPGEGELVIAFLEGALDGALATIDGTVPVFDPLATFGAYDPNAPGVQFSRVVGGTSASILTGANAGNAAKTATGATSLSQALFARGNGLLNSNDYFRIGFGWTGSGKAGHDVFRVAIGSKRGRVHWHIDLWRWWVSTWRNNSSLPSPR